MITISKRNVFILVLSVFVAFSSVSFVFAETDGNADTSTDDVDLGVENPGVLPTNSFYFFKEMFREVQRFFTFDPLARAELELKIIDQKAAELDAVSEIDSEDTDAIEDAIDNYNENFDELKDRLEDLAENSENPNIDELLDRLADRAIRHQELFDSLQERHEDLRDKIESAVDDFDDAIHPAFDRIGTCEELKNRIENFLQEHDNSPESIVRVLRLINRIEEHLESDETRSCFSELKERLSSSLGDRLDDSDDDIDDIIDRFHGDDRVRLKIIDELGDKLDSRLRLRLEGLRVDIRNRMHDDDDDSDDISDDDRNGHDDSDDIDDNDEDHDGVDDDVDDDLDDDSASDHDRDSTDVLCTEEYNPVCGEDGKTYSNECFAGVANVDVDYEGVCTGRNDNSGRGNSDDD